MTVTELEAEMTGEVVATYEVYVDAVGVNVGVNPAQLWKVSGVRIDTTNGRAILEVDEVLTP